MSKLNQAELQVVEKQLIELLNEKNDYLIGETLVYLNSRNSIDALRKRLNKADSGFEKIKWASFINDISNGDLNAEKIAFEEFENLEFIYEVQGIVFYDLIRFRSERIDELIETFVEHKYFLVEHHAKIVLNYKCYADKYTEMNKKKTTKKRSWEFWK